MRLLIVRGILSRFIYDAPLVNATIRPATRSGTIPRRADPLRPRPDAAVDSDSGAPIDLPAPLAAWIPAGLVAGIRPAAAGVPALTGEH